MMDEGQWKSRCPPCFNNFPCIYVAEPHVQAIVCRVGMCNGRWALSADAAALCAIILGREPARGESADLRYDGHVKLSGDGSRRLFELNAWLIRILVMRH